MHTSRKHLNRWLRRMAISAGMFGLAFGFMGIGCCDCFDEDVSIFHLRFNTDSLSTQGFRQTELRGAYLLAYATPNLIGQPDTFRQRLPQATSFVHGQYLNIDTRDGYVFLEGLARNPAGEVVKSYRLEVPAANRSFDFTDLNVAIGGGGGRCGCRYTKRKELTLEGQRIDAEKTSVPMLNR